MLRLRSRLATVAAFAWFAGLVVARAEPAATARVDFVRDVRPILDAACVKCHGPEKQRASLRFDSRASVLAGGSSGALFKAGDPGGSLLIRRLVADTAEEPRMPLKAPALSEAQVATLRAWVAQGADWPESAAAGGAAGPLSSHWAYRKPRRPEAPAVKDKAWPKNPIDAFILARLEAEGLTPSPEADKVTLIRRLSLDLVGLPPTPEEIDAFLADAGEGAYERLVDRLLASPRYGERWARPWLDLARYADSNGFEADARRVMWRYRDWVVSALNRDLSYRQFTIEQIAGDMLAGATTDQVVASGFHRNTMLNLEGGVDRGEQRWLTLVDRVGTTAQVFLGTTLQCAQCHNHKYDPFGQAEFYALLAAWENAEEPSVEVFDDPADGPRKKDLEARLAEAERELRSPGPRLAYELAEAQAAWELTALEGVPPAIRSIARTPPAWRTPWHSAQLAAHYRSVAPLLKPHRDRVGALRAEIGKIKSAPALVFRERPSSEPPATLFRHRGAYLSPGDKVAFGVPRVLHPLPEGAPRNRLGLAMWLVSEDNPLTARVAVNRFWESFFGTGLVDTPDDFGTMGAKPTHPELLDWLATEFVRGGWSMKALKRTIVTSATYRQSSRITPQLKEKDPHNRLLARGPRGRLEAEMIRDAALAASGVLSTRMGGPPVMPLQPDGVWDVPYSGDRWVTSAGEDRYRRSLYTFWRRSAPYPAFVAFDAPSREFCTVRRPRTNTPLQALVTLNDPAFFELARAMALRVIRESPAAEAAARLTYAHRLATGHRPPPEVTGRLVRLYESSAERYRRDSAAANLVLAGAAVPDGVSRADAAAMTLACNTLLNLDAALTKD